MTQPLKSLIFPLLLVLYEIAIYLSNDMYLPALPALMQNLNLNTHQAQLTLTGWFAGAASLPLFMGAITDYYGRRPVLFTGGIIYVLSTILCAVAPTLTFLLIARVIEGAMMATMLVPGYASIHESFDQKQAIRILAMMGSVTIIAPAFGPLLGGVILLFTTWRGIFWATALFSAAVILLLHFWMPETLPREKREPFHLRLLFAHYRSLLTSKAFLSHTSVLGFIYGGFLTWITAGPLLVMESFHQTAIDFGCIQAVIFGVYIIANRLVKYLMEWMGIPLLIKLGLLISLLGGIEAVIAGWVYPQSLYAFLLPMMVYSLGSGLNSACLNRLAIDACPTLPMGVRVSLFTVFITLFAAAGTVLSSVFFNGSTLSLASLLLLSAGISCIIKWLANV